MMRVYRYTQLPVNFYSSLFFAPGKKFFCTAFEYFYNLINAQLLFSTLKMCILTIDTFSPRFTHSETFTETFLLKVQVLGTQRSLIEFGKVPLVVSEFYGLSNTIDSSVLTFRSEPDAICTIRLLTSEINSPMLGQIVKEDLAQRDQASELIPGPRRGRTMFL